MQGEPAAPLAGADVLITRPAGQGGALARRVRALGGRARLLPGLSLSACPGDAAAAGLQAAFADDVLLFTSPAAVRYAARLAPLHGHGRVLAVGRGTAAALQHAGVDGVQAPYGRSQNSEGVLAHPWLREPRGLGVALVGAPGGRGLLAAALRERGARVREVHVYRRRPPRLTRRHAAMLAALDAPAYLLVSSGEALDNLVRVLPPAALERLRTCRTVVSSARLADAVRRHGFADPELAESARPGDLLAACVRLHARAHDVAPAAGSR